MQMDFNGINLGDLADCSVQTIGAFMDCAYLCFRKVGTRIAVALT